MRDSPVEAGPDAGARERIAGLEKGLAIIEAFGASRPRLTLSEAAQITGLSRAGIEVDRKVLSEMAIHEPAGFKAIVEKAKASLPAAA